MLKYHKFFPVSFLWLQARNEVTFNLKELYLPNFKFLCFPPKELSVAFSKENA